MKYGYRLVAYASRQKLETRVDQYQSIHHSITVSMITISRLHRHLLKATIILISPGVGLAATPSVQPLKSSAPSGLGPLALPGLQQQMIGSAFVFGTSQPDVFIATPGSAGGLFLLRGLRNSDSGVPIYGPAVRVRSPFSEKSAIVQTAGGEIHAVWIEGNRLRHGILNQRELAWMELGQAALTGLPGTAESVALVPNPDDSWEVVFEVSDGAQARAGSPNTVDWRPYDAAGIWTGGFPYRYLYAGRVQTLLTGPIGHLRQVSKTQREVYLNMVQITPVNLGEGRRRDLMTGSRQGILAYYHNAEEVGVGFEARRLAASANGVTLRNPVISAGVIALQNDSDGLSNLLVGGEGAVSFYKFQRRFTADGRPIFGEPTPALQESADLYAGTLPVPSAVDWNGDGNTDIVVGNSEGKVLFFRNIGDDGDPRFLPGVDIKAGGRVIHVQAGYSGSVNGVHEARWGYSSPNVSDWNGDALPDIIMGDITGNYSVYINKGSKTSPELEPAQPLYCDGLNLHGMWRVRPAVGRLGGRDAIVTVDGSDNLHLYWRLDDYNVEDGGLLRLNDGSLISVSGGAGGQTGRCKLSLDDWDQDGILDLVIAAGRSNAIPNTQTGFPRPTLGQRSLTTALFMKNVGSNERPVFSHPIPFSHRAMGIVQMGGAHEFGAVATKLGGRGPNLLIGNEVGRLFLLRRADLNWSREAAAAK